MNHIKNHLLDIDHLSKDFIYDFLTETKKSNIHLKHLKTLIMKKIFVHYFTKTLLGQS